MMRHLLVAALVPVALGMHQSGGGHLWRDEPDDDYDPPGYRPHRKKTNCGWDMSEGPPFAVNNGHKYVCPECTNDHKGYDTDALDECVEICDNSPICGGFAFWEPGTLGADGASHGSGAGKNVGSCYFREYGYISDHQFTKEGVRCYEKERQRLPRCECDTFLNGMDKADAGKHGCMRWHDNNPGIYAQLRRALSARQAPPVIEHEHPTHDAYFYRILGYQLACTHVDPSSQGGCPADQAKCEVLGDKLDLEECRCSYFQGDKASAHDHMCVTEYKTGGPRGGMHERVCSAPSNGYEAKFGEALQNYGCDHPGKPCADVLYN